MLNVTDANLTPDSPSDSYQIVLVNYDVLQEQVDRQSLSERPTQTAIEIPPALA